jgi:hypothetical protein
MAERREDAKFGSIAEEDVHRSSPQYRLEGEPMSLALRQKGTSGLGECLM